MAAFPAVIVDNRPALRGEQHDRELAGPWVLFVLQRQVAGRKNIESGPRDCFEQRAVFPSAEPCANGDYRFVIA